MNSLIAMKNSSKSASKIANPSKIQTGIVKQTTSPATTQTIAISSSKINGNDKQLAGSNGKVQIQAESVSNSSRLVK